MVFFNSYEEKQTNSTTIFSCYYLIIKIEEHFPSDLELFKMSAVIFAQWRSFVETYELGGEGHWRGRLDISDSRAKILQDGPHNTGIYNGGVSTPSAAAQPSWPLLIVARMYNKQRHNPRAFTCLIYDLPAIVSRHDGRGRMGRGVGGQRNSL